MVLPVFLFFYHFFQRKGSVFENFIILLGEKSKK